MVKRKSVLIAALVVVMSAALFAGCSTFPTIEAKASIDANYSIIGYVGESFSSYNEAFAAAREAYPEAQGVIQIKGRANNSLIPKSLLMGFYAVKFEMTEKEPRKKFLGIF